MEKEKLIEYINQGLSTWKIAELCNTTQPNIRYWLRKYNLKTQRTYNDLNNLKLCPCCNISKDKTEFYKAGKKKTSYCKACVLITATKNRKIVKQKAVEYLGGSCSRCGYNKCNAALDFHHTDPTKKDRDYSKLKSIFNDNLKLELDKCILLCANCHREIHSS